MNILIDIAHPAHIHLTRNVYFKLIGNGHKVIVTVKDIPAAISLLKRYEIPYVFLGKKSDSLLGKLLMQLIYNLKITLLIYKHNIAIGFGSSLTLAQLSKFTRMKSIILDDDDDDVEPLFVKYAHPYTDVILTPRSIKRKSKNTIYYNGYHELSYLHPNQFKPDSSVLSEIGLLNNEPFFILRFNSFKAHHDIGVQGLSIESKRKLISLLSKYGKIFITTERDIDDEFKNLQLIIAPEKIHSLMYYATMFIGDSQTMTSEASILGTPAIKCNTFAGKLSIPNEFEKKYGLCFSFLPNEQDNFFIKINELLVTPDLKSKFRRQANEMLVEKINVTDFFVWFIENYPDSKKMMRENPDFQYTFK